MGTYPSVEGRRYETGTSDAAQGRVAPSGTFRLPPSFADLRRRRAARGPQSGCESFDEEMRPLAASAAKGCLIAGGLAAASVLAYLYRRTRRTGLKMHEELFLWREELHELFAGRDGHTDLLEGHLAGQDKWLGGVLGANGNVYGVPGNSQDILKVDIRTDKVTRYGGPFVGRFKWLRGILARDRAVYCIPSWADHVLKINEDDSVELLGDLPKGQWKWHGGVEGPDGHLYGIPANSGRVLKVHIPSGEVTQIGPSMEGKGKWYGGLFCNNMIIGIPQNSTGLLVVAFDESAPGAEPEVRFVEKGTPGSEWTFDTGDEDMTQQYKWHGGVVSGSVIYGLPSHANSILKIDCEKKTVTTIGGPLPGPHRPDGKYKCLGAVRAPSGDVYIFPSDSKRVLKVNVRTDEVTAIGPMFPGVNKWQNGFLNPADNCIYGIPLRYPKVVKIDPRTDEVSTVGDVVHGWEKWEGAVLAENNAIYCMPLRAKQVLKINAGSGAAGGLAHAVES